MSFLASRNAISIGLCGIISFFGGRRGAGNQTQNNLLTESLDFLVQEDGGLILLE